ncbi:glucosamine inositolphosphorylceramide transferase family protein [Pontibacter kalidii]|uniref:glucosamine inositolphosphorylceramide transferase family protein n=1 Tax=Pontibacter kalidii TaxID=2592049 RepID=UPI002252CC0F|nr:hypothetical protein [Pontibacter kalidii]
MNFEKLKVALILDQEIIPLWQYQLIETLVKSAYAEISLVLMLTSLATNKRCRKRAAGKKYTAVVNLHLQVDRMLFGSTTNFDRPSDLKEALGQTDILSVYLKEESAGSAISNSKIVSQINYYDLDVILQLAGDKLSGEILSVPRYGVWAYQHKVNDCPVGYMEVVNQQDTLRTDLLLFSPFFPNGQLIYRSFMLPDHLSIINTQHAAYWRTSLAMPRILQGLFKYGEGYLQNLAKRFDTKDPKGRLEALPNPVQALTKAVSHFTYLLYRVWRKIMYRDHWFILFSTQTEDPLTTSLSRYKRLAQPADRFWADPFLVTHAEKHYLFVEELLNRTGKGHITVVETNSNGEVLHFEKVLEKEYHLSYPFLLNHNNTYYMIPETGANRTVELYRCTEFPYKWEFVMNLMENVLTADVTLFFYNGKWWMFCCVDGTDQNIGMLDELHLYYSEELFSTEWISHPCNPIITDVSRARPAGRIFMKDNKIYRPSQDCSGMYGKAININQVTALSETEYNEHLLTKILPDKGNGILGTHTYNFSDSFTVLDGFRYLRKRFL